jgi:hypothetical protein
MMLTGNGYQLNIKIGQKYVIYIKKLLFCGGEFYRQKKDDSKTGRKERMIHEVLMSTRREKKRLGEKKRKTRRGKFAKKKKEKGINFKREPSRSGTVNLFGIQMQDGEQCEEKK